MTETIDFILNAYTNLVSARDRIFWHQKMSGLRFKRMSVCMEHRIIIALLFIFPLENITLLS